MNNKIFEYIYQETVRQHSYRFIEMQDAWQYLRSAYGDGEPIEFAALDLQIVAGKIDKEMNPFLSTNPGYGNYRNSSVGFANGGSAAHPSEIQRLMDRLFEFVPLGAAEVDLWIKQLLQIHPWADANGRTASLYRNYLLGTLDDPTPLPDYNW
jgi:hypothetical protein